MYVDEEQKPAVMSGTNVVIAIALHLLVFLFLWSANQLRFTEKELIIPIELKVILHENLDGNENEPPPKHPPQPEPPKPKPPKPDPPKPDPPKPDPVKPPEAVEKIHEKTNVVKRVEQPKEPEKPKKTAAELRAERIARMIADAKDVKMPPKPREPDTNGKTAKQTLTPEQIRAMMMAGATAGAVEQIPPNEESRCLGCIKRAIDEQWRLMSPQIGRTGQVDIAIKLDLQSRVVASSISRSCGDAVSDNAALRVVRSLGPIRGLSREFCQKFSKESLIIRYTIANSK